MEWYYCATAVKLPSSAGTVWRRPAVSGALAALTQRRLLPGGLGWTKTQIALVTGPGGCGPSGARAPSPSPSACGVLFLLDKTTKK